MLFIMKAYKKIILSAVIFVVLSGIVSCTKYLDRAPDAGINETEVFLNFRNFQGFVEELYSCLPDMSKSTWNGEWNTGDDILSTTNANYRLNAEFDNGNYWAWRTNGGGWDNSWLDDNGPNTNPNESKNKGLWPLSWYGIRKANVGLANIDLMVDATDEEKSFVKGQLLFFRGFFHFQLMSFWGGLPYIDTVLSSSERLELPRLNYRETALRAAQDLEEAASLLPANWDNTVIGQATLGNNQQRITKSVALACKGKNLLYAASPMMNQQSTGSASYDQELCKQAADAFTRMLKLTDNGEAYYKLLPFDRYSENWYTISSYGKHPGYPEVVFGPPTYAGWQSRWSLVNMFIPPPLGGEAGISSPAANYVNNFGMANGLPLDAAGSGYDISDPWTGRDPRFYKCITYDGVRVIQGTANPDYRYANLYNGGNLRRDNDASRTGYLVGKYVTNKCNNVDNEWNNINIIIPYVRLADVYLMYAEAVLHGYGTPQSAYPGYLTAIEAVNKIRQRANVPDIDARYLGSKEAFMGEIIRERAVELAFEGLRWHDLRRWMLAGEKKYKEKTAIDFDRGANGKPLNLRERVVVTRVFDQKHNWLPLPTNQVNLYPSFGQNPGW
jgi:starch-binding outer membrane protein, SusD/RagB family